VRRQWSKIAARAQMLLPTGCVGSVLGRRMHNSCVTDMARRIYAA
jgi:hypothetical protein